MLLDNTTKQANLSKYLTNGKYDARKSQQIAQERKASIKSFSRSTKADKLIELLFRNGLEGS